MKSGLSFAIVIPLAILACSLKVTNAASTFPVDSTAYANGTSWSLNHPGESHSIADRSSIQPTAIQPITYQSIGSNDDQAVDYGNIRLANRFAPENAVIGADPLDDLYYETTSSDSPALPISNQIATENTANYRPTSNQAQCHDLGAMFCQMWKDICCDYCNYYSCQTLYDISIAIAIAAPFANTKADASFQNWYQEDVRSPGLNSFASFWKPFGEGQYMIPAAVGVWLLCEYYNQGPTTDALGEWGGRTTRAYLVGAIPLLLTQFTLGGGRPGEHACGSQWRPFQDSNAVSGHAFMGAVPFITAAKMSKRPLVKGIFYACSTFTAFSRVNDNDHYMTQICLGWWMAYIACNNVEKTELAKCPGKWTMQMQPVMSPGMSGVGVTISH